MSVKVAVAGASGNAGGELLRLINGHPELVLGPITAGTQVGSSVSEVHPGLTELSDRVFEPTETAVLDTADVVFLALPKGHSSRLAAELTPSIRVVDLGPDFRLTDPLAWERYYGGTHAGSWTYGLPEIPGARKRIAGARRVATPGCYATAVILALGPLLATGLIDPDDLVVTAVSGTSSGGRAAKASLAPSDVLGALRSYTVGATYRNPAEMEQELAIFAKAPVTVSFTPFSVPMPRGIVVSCSARLRDGTESDELRAALAEAYRDERFVRLLPASRWPATAAVTGTNSALLQAGADTRTGRGVVLSALDNLGKGAAGQAVQNANLMLGLPEDTGLTTRGAS
ncbi:N-acetyl-gamma-glutamyl-phosphate reductase [Amycolatopsis azurea]|uniref:N-acetyl-gamma-glutamyl-phosphate reductase n=1 Tax=Amycolatopsis azurea TaxID=36819 RepID=UPI003809D7D8